MSRSGPSYRGRVIFYPSTDWRNGSASAMKVTRSNRVSVTIEAIAVADGTPTGIRHGQGDGQLDYVISAKRHHYYEYALGVQSDLFDNILMSLMIIEVLEDVQVRALLGEP